MKHYISDLHFFNPQFLPWRRFASLEEETETVVTRWNAKIRPADDVYILGDFSQGTGAETNALLPRLNGSKTLLIGNHDEYLSDPAFDRSLFAEITPYKELEDGNAHVVLSHYPMPFYNGQYRFLSDPSAETYMLYGHLHCTFDEVLLDRYIAWARQQERNMIGAENPVRVRCNMINCCCYQCDYAPFTLAEWIEKDARQRARRRSSLEGGSL